MLLEIEYYKQDTQLLGKETTFSELKKQLSKTEVMFDIENDNFVELFCRMFQWSEIYTNEIPDYIYDRDIKRLYKPE